MVLGMNVDVQVIDGVPTLIWGELHRAGIVDFGTAQALPRLRARSPIESGRMQRTRRRTSSWLG
jgi:hypothetical protein